MSSGGALGSRPLDPDLKFNWRFLVELLICGVLTIFFLFHFNRVLGRIVSFVLRAYLRTWHGFPVYINIESLQVSLVAGRVFFGRVTYHGINETILIVNGHITWRYWLRKVRHVGESGGVKGISDLPCRFLVKLHGLEWFVYNRSPAYDAIITQMAGGDEEEDGRNMDEDSGEPSFDAIEIGREEPRLGSDATFGFTHQTLPNLGTSDREAGGTPKSLEMDSTLLRLLPIRIECSKGGLVLGNSNTPSILVGHFSHAHGSIDATQSQGPDKYKQIFSFHFSHPVIQLKENGDYKEPQLSRGARLMQRADFHPEKVRRHLWGTFRELLPLFQSSTASLAPTNHADTSMRSNNEWIGLSRYLDDAEQEEAAKFEPDEYAKVSTVLDSPEADISIYWDIPGTVPVQAIGSCSDGINSSSPPEWGIDFAITGGIINYGPWADRQRIQLQNMLFPKLFKDARPAKKLVPGSSRQSTVFKLLLELRSATRLRIPIREQSKDWKYKKKSTGGEVRNPGWLDLKVSEPSTISNSMSLVPSSAGWDNKLLIDLRSCEVRTSVNHCLLLQTNQLTMDCDISAPLSWNSLHRWRYSLTANKIDIFLLREHVTLLTDLITDWATGPQSDYYTFVPFKYYMQLKFTSFRLFFNVNDDNIINNASDLEDNTFLILSGDRLTNEIEIPLHRFRTPFNEIPFIISAPKLNMTLRTPPWNTQSSFLLSNYLASTEDFCLNGKYHYFANTAAHLIDTIILDITGSNLNFNLYGFLIRYFLIIKENYFGENLHFKTLEEYKKGDADGSETSGTNNLMMAKTNDIDVILTVEVRNGTVIFPAHIYSVSDGVELDVALVSLDMRFTNYYMDLQVNFSPISASACPSQLQMNHAVQDATEQSAQLLLHSLVIYGHRLFGLPPSEPTYVCNWDLNFGAVTGKCNARLIQLLLLGLDAFEFSYKDTENALPTMVEVLHDVTFARVVIDSIKVSVQTEPSPFLISTSKVDFMFNDWAGERLSDKITLEIPSIIVACVDSTAKADGRDIRSAQSSEVQTHAYVSTALRVLSHGRKRSFPESLNLQQRHIRDHDSRTNRSAFLLHKTTSGSDETSLYTEPDPQPPSLSVPSLPPPVYGAVSSPYPSGALFDHDTCSRHSGREKRCGSSFLTFAASSKSSLNGTSSSGAPSFHSALQSTGEYLLTTAADEQRELRAPRRSKSFRLISQKSSPNRQLARSVYTTTQTLPSSTFNYSLFASDDFELDLTYLPSFDEEKGKAAPPYVNDQTVGQNYVDQEKRDSIVVDMSPGLRGFFDAHALRSIACLLGEIEPHSAEDILDHIHIHVVKKITEKMIAKSSGSTLLEICLKVPQTKLRFLQPATPTKPSLSSIADIVDLSILQATIAVRSKEAERTVAEGLRKTYSIHLLADNIRLALGEATGSSELIPAVEITVNEVLFWASTNALSTASLQLKSFDFSAESKQAPYLLKAGERLSSSISSLTTSWAAVSQTNKRAEFLVYALALAGEEHDISHEPLALTRPSYVLRSALNHVRIDDSWKLNARIRHIYYSLPTVVQNEISSRCPRDYRKLPAEAHAQVVHIFEKWRSWELRDVGDSHFIHHVFGIKPPEAKALVQPINRFIAKIGLLTLGIDPGPTQQEVFIDNLVVAMAFADSPDVSIGRMRDASTVAPFRSSNIIQLYSRNCRIHLTWEILDILELFLRTSNTAAQNPTTPMDVSNSAELLHQNYHIVMATETGSVNLESVNLKFMNMGHNLWASIMVSDQHAELEKGMESSFLIRAALASSEISHANKLLGSAKFRRPSVYTYFDQHCVAETCFNVWKISGSCDDISLSLPEEVLGLVEVFDFIVSDEISQIYQLVSQLSKTEDSVNKTPRARATRMVHMLDLALSVETLKFNMVLLPSLIYSARGHGIQASVRAKHPPEIIVDLNVRNHEHEIRSGYKSDSRSIGKLEVPAVNIRLRKSSTGAETPLAEAFISIEAVELDASSIQNIINALKKPEVVNVCRDAKNEISLSLSRLQHILASSEPSSVSQRAEGPEFLYVLHAGVAGLTIETEAPSARLSLNFGTIRVRATNTAIKLPGSLAVPEIFVELQRITVDLTKVKPNELAERCGYIEVHASLACSSKRTSQGQVIRTYQVKSHSLRIDLFAETASTIVDVVGDLQDKLRDLDLSREVKYLRRFRKPKTTLATKEHLPLPTNPSSTAENAIVDSVISLDMNKIQVSWIVGTPSSMASSRGGPNLCLSVKKVDFAGTIKKRNDARLTIEGLLLQIVDDSKEILERAENSAFLPEIVFRVAHYHGSSERRLNFQAKGSSLHIKLNTSCLFAANTIQNSMADAGQRFRQASSSWKSTPTSSGDERKNIFGAKRLASVLIDGDFEGAVVELKGAKSDDTPSSGAVVIKPLQQGRLGQFSQGESGGTTILRSPGLAFKLQYLAPLDECPSLNGEIKVSASSNTLYPSVVTHMMEIMDGFKNVFKDTSSAPDVEETMLKPSEDTTSEAASILGNCRLNLGLRLCRQEFSLSCQPIARVAATASYKEIYVTLNTCEEMSTGRFYAVSVVTSGLRCSLQHVYSREPTGNLEVESLVISLMNNKHLSGSEGLSCIMKVSPIKAQLNVKQIQDFLLFREIWLPDAILEDESQIVSMPEEPQQLVQRYHRVAAAKAFPWNTTIAITSADLQLDLGPSLGKTSLILSSLWLASRKTSDWEQSLCLGLRGIEVKSAGRLGGFMGLRNFRVRSSIQWVPGQDAQPPLVQASLGLEELKVKAAFDYQPFLVADIAAFEFLMYNLRHEGGDGDRLVGVLEGDKVQVFCTSLSASQGLALYQAFLRLVQEKLTSFDSSLKDIEKYLQRRASSTQHQIPSPKQPPSPSPPKDDLITLTLHADVIVNLREINIGAFPSTFMDSQVFRLEALNVGARFAVDMEGSKLHSQLGMTLGQLRVALSSTRKSDDGLRSILADIKLEDVISNATSSQGGTILRVPQVRATMHTWHIPGSTQIEYTFKSSFEGKVDVGWNYSRISFIKGMWANHVEAMAQRRGKPTERTSPASHAITITAEGVAPSESSSTYGGAGSEKDFGGTAVEATTAKADPSPGKAKAASSTPTKGKITAVVNVPQSRYEYIPLETPIIETPQLRDMGEATPPLEWIGLNRERLPNLTHQIVIVSLLEIAREVEDAYGTILGSSVRERE